MLNLDEMRKDRKVLVVRIGGEEHKVPLADSMSLGEVMAMRKARKEGDDETFDWIVSFFHRYIGDVVDELSAEEFGTLVEAWFAACERCDVPMGES